MSFWSLLTLAVGLAMDATAVAGARGLAAQRVHVRDILLVALLFGGFQAGMPLIGYLIGARLGSEIEAWDHWIAFALLVAIGGKMLWEARRSPEERRAAGDAEPFAPRLLVALAVATSIDALAVGVALPLLDVALAPALVTIGVATAVLSGLGVIAGRRLGASLGRRLDVLGGLVLIALGLNILLEHLGAG